MINQFELLPIGVQVAILVIGTILALGIGLFSLAFAAAGGNRVKRELRVLVKGDVLQLLDGLATAPLGSAHRLVDEPTDALILLIAQAFKKDPETMVKQIDQGFVLLGKLQQFWPQIKDALGLTDLQPPKPPEGEKVAIRKLEPSP